MPQKSRRGIPLKKAEDRMTRRLQVQVTEAEYARLMTTYDPEIYPSKAAYYRARMVAGEVTVTTRDGSLDRFMPLLGELRDHLSRIGGNINQVVRHMNTYKRPASDPELVALVKLLRANAEIMQAGNRLLHGLGERWS